MNDLFYNIYSWLSGFYSDAWDSYLYDNNCYTWLGITSVALALLIALIFYFKPTVRWCGSKWWGAFMGICFLLVMVSTLAESICMFNEAGSDEVSDCGFLDLLGTALASGLLGILCYFFPFSLFCFLSTHNYKVPIK